MKLRVEAADIRQKILEALKQSAETEAESIKVMVQDDKVTLHGKVHDLHEQYVLSRAVRSAPCVT